MRLTSGAAAPVQKYWEKLYRENIWRDIDDR
jgi:hypothetical protein